ncbi:LacI family transcriptional regulator [Sinosporangium album]|uniref:LacI family transcriptional regulator n=1 Tax=Sinosporangium album TaxID=504805 RepID=A0A1G7R7D6_9ACTN|nr:substrate-binding domain-containing protein [Sinosporangium album]SDG06627.1 LacI family transcriptional regulator [Sinosporangium album]
MKVSGHHRITIKDVAAAAGVGVATVSRVLSGGSASPETRERVLAAAARLDYRPSALGRNLRQRRTGGIALLVPDITDTFYGRLTEGVLSCARSAGEPVMIGATGDDPELEAELIGTFLEQSVDRVIAVPCGDADTWTPALRAGLTVVFAHRRPPGRDDVPAVLSDDRLGVRTAVEYLAGLGHRRIAYLGGPGQGPRLRAFRDTLAALGITLDDELVVSARAARDSAYAAASGLFQHRPDLTAVLAGGNVLGEAAVLAARELDLRLPRDVSIVMFDDVPWAELCSPPLTVIAQPAQDIGYRAAELVMRESARRTRDTVLPTELLVRGSCGPRR